MPEHRADGFILEMEQPHLPAQTPVVPALCFFEPVQVLFELLVAGPGRAVDALQHLVARVATPVRAGKLGELERLAEPPGRRQVRTAAQIDESALPVERHLFALGDVCDDLGLVGFSLRLEELDGLGALPDLPHDGLVARDDFAHARFDELEILRGERFLAGEIVVKAVLDGGPDGDLRLREKLFHRFGHRVSCVMAQHLQALRGGAGDDLNAGVALDGRGQVPQLAVDADRHGRFRQTGPDGLRHGQTGHGFCELFG